MDENINDWVSCESCEATGRAYGPSHEPCPSCSGQGGYYQKSYMNEHLFLGDSTYPHTPDTKEPV